MGGKAMSWKFIGTRVEGSFIINSVDIFNEEWLDSGIKVKVKDPLYGEIHTFRVWSITSRNNKITFAAGEFSNNVCGIYTKEDYSSKNKSPIFMLKKLFKGLK
jgi:hypothetical protein